MRNYAISNSSLIGGLHQLPQWVSGLENSGVDMVQIREKSLPAGELVLVVAACLLRCRKIKLLVNTQVDVALACGAHGAHLPGDSPPPFVWREIVPSGFLFGVSCHSMDESLAAQRGGADFIVAAPVFDPLSKSATRQPLGIEELSRICGGVAVPVYALGGVTRQNAAECAAAGAVGVAGITLYLG